MAWVERRGMPVTEVFAAQYEFAFTGGFIRSIPGVTQDRMPTVFSVGDQATYRMGDLVREAPLWVPLPPPSGHPPIPGRLERAKSIDDYPVVTIAFKLEGTDQWLTAYRFLRPSADNGFVSQLYFSALAMLVVALIALVIGNRVIRPFQQLAHSAEQLGRGERGDPVAVSGPSDMQSIITAFDRMNMRVTQSIDYQIGLLRSLGHDIKGPLNATSRLLEEVQPGTTRVQIADRLSRMRGVVASIMSFSRAVMRDGPHRSGRPA